MGSIDKEGTQFENRIILETKNVNIHVILGGNAGIGFT